VPRAQSIKPTKPVLSSEAADSPFELPVSIVVHANVSLGYEVLDIFELAASID